MMTGQQQQTLEHLHSNFAQRVALFFSASQELDADVNVIFADQTLFSEFIESRATHPCSHVFNIEPKTGQAIIDFPPPMAYSLIEQQLGGTGYVPPKEPHSVTGSEKRAIQSVATDLLQELEKTWQPVVPFQISQVRFIDTNTEYAEVAAPSDLVVIVGLGVNSQRISGQITLIYPFSILESISSIES